MVGRFLATLTDQIANLVETITLNPYIPHEPTPKQWAFLALDDLEAFYGGAAGPGKSDALLMAALQYVHVPGYAALLLRRTYADLSLPDPIMDRAHHWLGGLKDAHWSDKSKTYTFPSGATLTFGYLDGPRDHFRYQGAQFTFIGFDELTQFSEYQYRYLFSRLRRLEGASVPLRMRGASNPGDMGHEWVKARFVDPGSPERPFVRAMIEDNPHLDREAYIATLQHLDPITRLQLLRGDWTARQAGAKFKREWFKLVDVAPADVRWCRFWDLAGTEPKKPGDDPDYTAGVLMGARNGTYCIADVRRARTTPGGVEALVSQTAGLDPEGTMIRMEQEPGSSGKTVISHYRRHVLTGLDFRGIPSTGSKEIRANPFASEAEAGNAWLVRGPWVEAYLEEMELAFGPSERYLDQVDASSGAYGVLARRSTIYTPRDGGDHPRAREVMPELPTLGVEDGFAKSDEEEQPMYVPTEAHLSVFNDDLFR